MWTATSRCARVDELINDERAALVTGGVLFDGLFIPQSPQGVVLLSPF